MNIAIMTEKKRAIALGFFDGLHIGHAAVMKRTLEIADEKNLLPSVITFDTHPQCFVNNRHIALINSHKDRAGMIERLFGIDDMIFLHIDAETVNMPWDIFIDHLIEEFGAHHLIAGYDFRFGAGGKGDSRLLGIKCGESAIGCDIVPEVRYDGTASSSSYIRTLLLDGDIERANAFLGHPHVLTDTVRYGYKLGRTLGTPTINMCFEPGVLIPAHGVYATKVFPHCGSEFIGVTNIGTRPTFGNSDFATAETHILNFRQNLYGHKVRIEFHKHLRPEIKFDDLSELKTQIKKDCETAAQHFGSY